MAVKGKEKEQKTETPTKREGGGGNKEEEHNTICTFKRKRGQKSSQGLSIYHGK